MQSEGSHSMWFTFRDIQQFSVLFKNEDGWCQQDSRTVRKFKNWPIFVFIYFNTSTFHREKATTEKVSSGSLLSSAGEVLGISGAHPEVGIGQVRVMQFSECRMPGTQPPSAWFDQQWLWEGVAFKEQSERSWGSGDYQAEKVETFKDDSAFDFPGGSVVKHLPCNVRDTGLISRSGRFHRPGSNWAHASQLLSPCTAKKNPLAPTKVPCAATEAWYSQVKKERS